MKPLRHPSMGQITLHDVLYALADPVRLAIVRALHAQGVMNCTRSCGEMALPKATLSRHFDQLRAAGLIRTERDGVQYLNVLRTADLEARFPGLLDSLLQAAERDAGPRRHAHAKPSRPTSARRRAAA